MLLTALVETLVEYLNGGKSAWTTDDSLVVKAELDPVRTLLPALGVYILPGFVDYGLVDAGKSRGKLRVLPEILICTLCVGRVFTEIPIDSTDGIANWDEAKPIIDTRQRIEEYLAGWESSPLTINAIESHALEELELDSRNFLALTFFSFEQVICPKKNLLT